MFKVKLAKKSMIMALLVTIPLCALASNHDRCAKKEENLQRQLSYAKHYGNQHRIVNIQIALDNVRIHCGQKGSYDQVYDSEYYSDENYVRHLEEKITKHREKVREAEYELEKAKMKGKPKKIAQKEEKLQARKAELDSYLKTKKTLVD